MVLKIGTCGWSVRGGRKEYFKLFSVIELQSTFYKLPRETTAIKWRENAPEDFEFTVKAWQVLTHSPRSPTWRRANIKVEGRLENFGLLKPTEENFRAWEKVLRICKILKTSICIFQTPPSFGFSPENKKNVIEFFSSIERGGLTIGWEPRGTWHEHPDELKSILSRLDIVHVVDILRRRPVVITDPMYFRLHGLGGKEVNYRYKYTDSDLRELLTLSNHYLREVDKVYVMFNNMYMAEDATRFKELARIRGLEVR